MIPAAFDYVRVDSVEEAIGALAEHGDEAKILAGGHSLLPLMKLRFAMPEVLVDVGRVAALKGVSDAGDELVIGAMTTHHQVTRDPLVRDHCGVLADVAAVVGDAQVRHRGTIGGATAHGDAAGDLPATLLALEATMVAHGRSGLREIAAADFFVGHLTTALGDDEVLTEIRVPKLDADWAWHYEKFSRVAQAWAIVGSLALVRRSNGTIEQARVGLTHMDAVPVRASATEAALAGASAEAITAAAEQAAEATSPPEDLSATPEFRAHLARVLTRRALEAAAG